MFWIISVAECGSGVPSHSSTAPMKAVSALFGHSIAAVHSIIASRNQIRGYRTAGDRDIIAIFLSPVEVLLPTTY